MPLFASLYMSLQHANCKFNFSEPVTPKVEPTKSKDSGQKDRGRERGRGDRGRGKGSLVQVSLIKRTIERKKEQIKLLCSFFYKFSYMNDII